MSLNRDATAFAIPPWRRKTLDTKHALDTLQAEANVVLSQIDSDFSRLECFATEVVISQSGPMHWRIYISECSTDAEIVIADKLKRMGWMPFVIVTGIKNS